MKCNTCIHEWKYSGDWTSPYGEWSCMKTENDLYGTNPEDVEDCKEYECKNKDNEYIDSIVEDIKVKVSLYDVLLGSKLIR